MRTNSRHVRRISPVLFCGVGVMLFSLGQRASRSLLRDMSSRGPIDFGQIGVDSMSFPPRNNDHQRRHPNSHRARHSRQPLTAALLALLGFVVLLAYSAIGPRSPVAQATGTQEISATALTDHECNDTEWHFVITQIDTEADAPATIHVEWANGNSEDVPLDKFTGGVAHYATTDNLDSTVTSATAEIYAGWHGQFNLSHGPCGTPSTTSPPPSTTTAPPSTTTAPPSTTTSPPLSSSSAAVSSSSAPVAAPSTSPFVPGPGQTGDSRPGGGSPLRKILLAVALALLGSALAIAVQPLRRRGNHS
jgi:hypothetical protein